MAVHILDAYVKESKLEVLMTRVDVTRPQSVNFEISFNTFNIDIPSVSTAAIWIGSLEKNVTFD